MNSPPSRPGSGSSSGSPASSWASPTSGAGNGNGNPGFDCSGLTHAAYAAAGLDIPRTAQTQYNTGPLLPAGEPLQPGDLVFFGTPGRIHHIGISLGSTLIIHAPDVGQVVQFADYRIVTDYADASRPAQGTGLLGMAR